MSPRPAKRRGDVRPAGQIRQSQIVTTFGPGAMVDQPEHAVEEPVGRLAHRKVVEAVDPGARQSEQDGRVGGDDELGRSFEHLPDESEEGKLALRR